MKFLEKIVLDLGNISLTIVRDENLEIKKKKLGDIKDLQEQPELIAYLKAISPILEKDEVIDNSLYHITLMDNEEKFFKFIFNEEQLRVFIQTLSKSVHSSPPIGYV